ncbi:helix-turn-helix transcriptional regulator [Rhizobium sp. Nf11,1]|uniref:helix-turn-helix transcriptional regulator n=1 Tax=Rhizobium sp. Nf11,1 TaxID=3404923 RepID=UPI003D325D64
MKTLMLSPLEKACLQWVSKGRTAVEIALLEGKSVIEIELCLGRALTALGAQSMMEALKKASGPDT